MKEHLDYPGMSNEVTMILLLTECLDNSNSIDPIKADCQSISWASEIIK